MKTRTEKDTMGPIEVPADKYWGAQTQRSVENFKIGEPASMPREIIMAAGAIPVCLCGGSSDTIPTAVSHRSEMAPASLPEIGKTLTLLQAAGVRVVMIGQSPEFVQDVHVIAFSKGDKNSN